MTRRGVAFLIVVLGCVFPACSEAFSGQEPGMMPGASTAPPRDAAAQDPQGGKPLPPLEVAIALERAHLTVGETFTAAFTFTPLADAPRAAGRLEAEGIVSPLDESALQWHDLPANHPEVVRGRFCLTGPGEGEIRGTVDVGDDAGQSLYGRSAVLYVVVIDDIVLTGTSSPLLLRLEYLDRQLRAGAITQQDYERARDQLLGGGATGTDRGSAPPVSVPSTDPCGAR